jgi:hypothetical protein
LCKKGRFQQRKVALQCRRRQGHSS